MSDSRSHLKSMYPFLEGNQNENDALDSALLESVRQKASHSIDVKQSFFAEYEAQVVTVAKAIADVYRKDRQLFTMGNGGSSCDSSHIAVEFLHPITTGRPALTAIDLASDTAMMTAVGNDVGFKHIFVRQLIAYAKPGDGLIGVSASGNSENLLTAFAKAKEMGLTTIGLAGMDGGEMASSKSVDHCLTVHTDSIHRIQETHVAIYHILWDLVHTLLADTRGELSK